MRLDFYLDEPSAVALLQINLFLEILKPSASPGSGPLGYWYIRISAVGRITRSYNTNRTEWQSKSRRTHIVHYYRIFTTAFSSLPPSPNPCPLQQRLLSGIPWFIFPQRHVLDQRPDKRDLCHQECPSYSGLHPWSHQLSRWTALSRHSSLAI